MSYSIHDRYLCTVKRISFCVFPRGTLTIFKSQQPKSLAENSKSGWNHTGQKASWSRGGKKAFAVLCDRALTLGEAQLRAAGALRGPGGGNPRAGLVPWFLQEITAPDTLQSQTRPALLHSTGLWSFLQ